MAERRTPTGEAAGVEEAAAAGGASEEAEVDEELYSRQLYVMGREASVRMGAASVLVCGLGGLGVEVAKNVILTGVRCVTLYDPHETTWHDLSSQFYLRAEEVGRGRAEACLQRLRELNDHVRVTTTPGPLTPALLASFTAVVLTDSSLEEQLRVSDECHSLGVPLVVASTRGLFGQLFCDFGEEFEVVDPSGKEPAIFPFISITREAEGVVTLPPKTFHQLQDDDLITFNLAGGVTHPSLAQPRPVQVLSASSFSVGDTRDLPHCKGGGVCRQVKQSRTMSFLPLREAIHHPEIVPIDFVKDKTTRLIHVAFLALHQYQSTYGALPRPWHEQDAEDFLEVFASVNDAREDQVEVADQELLKTLAFTSRGQLVAMNAVIGGMAAQEVTKACSAKFTPLHQWLYFDAVECLPEDTFELRQGLAEPRDDRYDGQVAVFGRRFQETLGRLRYFVVGAGAIGCELLKNLAMMGVGVGMGGSITVTDMDVIERSNLSRQFLFRPWDIKQPKSSTAATAVVAMNPAVNVKAHQLRVGPETEQVYNAHFYESLDGVANALDNIEARRYMDRCCWQYRKPLLESGTLGTNGSVQVVVPHLTERYANFQVPTDKAIAVCTLRYFPAIIEHTLQWARDEFEGEFFHTPETARHYMAGELKMDDILKLPHHQDVETLNTLKKMLTHDFPKTFDDCVGWARRHWQRQYHDSILDLLHDFPPDMKTTNGGPFWSGSKRCPHTLSFNADNALHLDYIHAAANLRAAVFGIPQQRDRKQTRAAVAMVEVDPYQYTCPPRLEEKEEVVLQLQQVLGALGALGALGLHPLIFEKDDDSNFHIDFITAASNLRAANYNIEPADRSKSKRISGRIIPAIVTSTAVVAGLATLELLKVAQGHRDIERYRNSEFNLGLCRFCVCEPEQAPVHQYNGVSWTLWDRFEVSGDLTLEQFLDHFRQQEKLEVTMVSCGRHTIHSFLLARPERQRRMTMRVNEVMREVAGAAPDVLMLDICAEDTNGEDIDVPHVRYCWGAAGAAGRGAGQQ